MNLPAYTVTRKPVKYTRIRVLAPDGRVSVSAPRYVSEAEIAAFVAQKAEDHTAKFPNIVIQNT